MQVRGIGRQAHGAKGSRKSLMKVGALRGGAQVWKEHGSPNLKTALTADNMDEYQELTMASDFSLADC